MPYPKETTRPAIARRSFPDMTRFIFRPLRHQAAQYLCAAALLAPSAAMAWPPPPPNGGPGQAAATTREILLDKARSLEGRGRLDLAAQTWRQLLLMEPNLPEALASLARYAKQQGKADESRRLLEQLRRVNPGNGAIQQVESTQVLDSQKQRLEQASNLARQGQTAAAMALYREVFAGNPPAGAWALAYHETDAGTPGGWERATAALSKLTQTYPNAVEYKIALGTLYTYRPETRLNGIRLLEAVPTAAVQYGKARQAWRQALVWEGANPAVGPSLRAYVSRHADADLSRAIAALPAAPAERQERTLQSSPEELAAYDDLTKNQLLAAETKFAAVLKQHPNSASAHAGMGFVRMRQEEFPAALQSLEKANSLQPGVVSVQKAIETSQYFKALREGSRLLLSDRAADAGQRFEEALAVRPKDTAATRGLAGVHLKLGKAREATALFEGLVKTEPEVLDNWRGLVNAQYQTVGAKATLAVVRSIPESMQAELEKSVDYLGLLASAHAEVGATQESSAYVERAMVAARAAKLPTPNTLMLQVAGTNLNQGNFAKAAELYEAVIRSEPYNMVAYEGLLATLLQNKDHIAAHQVVERMPADLYQAALKRPGFLRSAAVVQARNGKIAEAEALLSRVIREDGPAKVAVGVQLQLAEIWIQQGRATDAEALARELLAKHRNDPSVWRTLLAALKQRELNESVLAELLKMPEAVATALNTDPDHLRFVAGVHSNLGNLREATKLVDLALKAYDSRKADAPAELLLQHAWLLLDGKAEDRQVYAALNRISFQRNLTPKQEESHAQLWSIWSRRRAEDARQAGDLPRATQILEAASRLLPKDSALRSSLAGTWLLAGDARKAVALYKAWNFMGAEAADYVGAVGAASGENPGLAQKWLQDGLKKYPQNPQLLSLAGQLATQRGDFKKAEQNYRAALAASRTKEAVPGEVSTGPQQLDSRRSLARLLLNDTDAPEVEGPNGEAVLRAINGEAVATPAAANALVEARRAGLDEIAERLQALESRNTPYASIEGNVSTRNGNAGFENRSLQETTITSSLIVADAFRLSLVARPTVIQTGAQDGRTEVLRLGLAPQGTMFAAQSQSGIAAELQLSTANFGLRAGMSPQGFLVKNYIAALRYRPAGGPITITIDRDNIKDSLLSFAGVRDSITKQVFGGVVGNRFGVGGNWGSARRGLYLSGGYQTITGQQVQANRRYDGGGGAYYQILTRKEGNLTTGVNLFLMSYDHNLRYYTLGHGGYFSPQMFSLVNVPLLWRGAASRRFEYSVGVSFGSQSFREDASPYFPTMTALQGQNGPYYDRQQVAGASYALDFNGLYQLNPNWYLGVFVNVNNARNFRSQSAGFSLKYAFKAKPLGSAFNSSTIPDWKGIQPFNAN
jgi:tetratricopeptide (TPR) repeat protein